MMCSLQAPLTQEWFSGRSCMRSNWNLEMLIFGEMGKAEENLLEQSKRPTINLTHIRPQVRNQIPATLVDSKCNIHYTTPALYCRDHKKYHIKFFSCHTSFKANSALTQQMNTSHPLKCLILDLCWLCEQEHTCQTAVDGSL